MSALVRISLRQLRQVRNVQILLIRSGCQALQAFTGGPISATAREITGRPATSTGRSPAPKDFEQLRRERRNIEMRFAHLMRILKLGRLRLRGPRDAQDEIVLAAIAENLRRLASLVARPPPTQALCTA